METEKKRELAAALVDAMHGVTGHPKEILVVLFHENKPENVAPAGQLLVDRR